jgi:hypothetical protein
VLNAIIANYVVCLRCGIFDVITLGVFDVVLGVFDVVITLGVFDVVLSYGYFALRVWQSDVMIIYPEDIAIAMAALSNQTA